MNKILVTGLVLLLTSCTLPLKPPSSEPTPTVNLIGQWHCTLNYTDLDIQSQDRFKLSENGEISNDNVIGYPIENPVLQYRVHSQGKWQFEEGQLHFTLLEKSVHKEKIEDSSKLKDKTMENKLLALLNTPVPEEFSFSISNLTQNSFNLHQHIDNQSYLGLCTLVTQYGDYS